MDSKDITNSQRQAFERFIKDHKLKLLPWAKKAGVSEATIRNYLKGRNQSLTAVTLTKLANAVGVEPDVLIGIKEEVSSEIDHDAIYIKKDLFIKAFIDMEEFLTRSNIILNSVTKINAVFTWYELIQMLEKNSTTMEDDGYDDEDDLPLYNLVHNIINKKIS